MIFAFEGAKMRRPIPISSARVDELVAFRETKWTGFEFQRFLCIWLRVECGQTPAQIAETLGWHLNTVRATQQDFAHRGIEAIQEKSRGGRHNASMTVEEEAAFLNGFTERDGEGSLLVVAEVRRALETHLGKPIADSTIYRLLARHGWRKVVPRTFHPKQDPEAAQAFKKGVTRSTCKRPRKGPPPKASRRRSGFRTRRESAG